MKKLDKDTKDYRKKQIGRVIEGQKKSEYSATLKLKCETEETHCINISLDELVAIYSLLIRNRKTKKKGN